MKLKIFFFCLSIVLISCSQPTKDVIIDNPSESDIIVKLNQTEPIKIMSKSKISVPLKYGKEQLQVNDDEPVDVYLDKDYDYVLNPTLKNYYIENVVYTLNSKGGENYIEDYGQITSKVGEREVDGDFRMLSPSFAMAKTWSFGLDDQITGVVYTSSEGRRGYKLVKRLVRESDVEIMAMMSEILDDLNVEAETE